LAPQGLGEQHLHYQGSSRTAASSRMVAGDEQSRPFTAMPLSPPPPYMYKRRQRSIKRNKDSFVLSIQVHSTYFILNTSSTHRITLSVRRHSQRAVQDHPEKVSQDGEASTYHYTCKFDPLSSGLSRSNKHTQTPAPTMSSWPVGSPSPLDSTRGGP
jgi:hypothetical protein